MASETLSPLLTDFDAVNANEYSKTVPDDDHTLACVRVSEPAVQVVQVGAVPDIDRLPPLAAASVRVFFEVSADAFDVPADPGSPVCNAIDKPDSSPSQVFARVAETPAVTLLPRPSRDR